MTARDKQKVKGFLVSLAILALTLYLAYQVQQPSAASAVQGPAGPAKPSGKPNSPVTDARIHIDLLEADRETSTLGRKNLFQYGPVQPPRPVGPDRTPPTVLPAPEPGSRPAVIAPPPTPAPPPPPPIPLKYTGFAVIDPVKKTRAAFLSDDRSGSNFNVLEGDVIVGRYRVLKISDESVEVEDLEYTRKQVLPLVK